MSTAEGARHGIRGFAVETATEMTIGDRPDFFRTLWTFTPKFSKIGRKVMQSFDRRELTSEQLAWVARWERTVDAWFEDPGHDEMLLGAPSSETGDALVANLREAGYLVQRSGTKVLVKKPSRVGTKRLPR